ncbi:Linoleate 13S-lipoxygenase 2-1, chloroplastic [Senna tora]|uniref:Linoleate 13S-lipoxygenase 2-1, chloroplastic n=1 Tax=Senna tora TaxID=362788 RepID=A0A834WSU8_9FABA|nr:Linoleate 13S-lipoxygenase 2-1, chloroplastic [Senna tora]
MGGLVSSMANAFNVPCVVRKNNALDPYSVLPSSCLTLLTYGTYELLTVKSLGRVKAQYLVGIRNNLNKLGKERSEETNAIIIIIIIFSISEGRREIKAVFENGVNFGEALESKILINDNGIYDLCQCTQS